MLGRVGARRAATHNKTKNVLKKQNSSWKHRLGFGFNPNENVEDEADNDLHSTILAYKVHVERFLAQLPTLHRRDQAKEFFQLSRVRAAPNHPSGTHPPIRTLHAILQVPLSHTHMSSSQLSFLFLVSKSKNAPP